MQQTRILVSACLSARQLPALIAWVEERESHDPM
ncbi:UNVERIFIED_ORG: hypothetical protein J2806_004534 [Kosakonia oryzae]|nr:hypothetical protein [Kosakonia oryzae]